MQEIQGHAFVLLVSIVGVGFFIGSIAAFLPGLPWRNKALSPTRDKAVAAAECPGPRMLEEFALRPEMFSAAARNEMFVHMAKCERCRRTVFARRAGVA